MRSWILISAIALCAAGCAPRARFMAMRPAELDIGGIGRLAVVDFQGQGDAGAIARSVVLAQLAENRHYTLIDQAELARVQPAAFTQGIPGEAAAVEAARQAGIDAVLTGQVVSYNVDDHVQQDNHISIAGGGSASKAGDKAGGLGIGIDSNTLHSRDASVSLAFKLIDARTGQVRDARQVTHTFEGRVVNGEGTMPGREQILNDLLRKCAQDVVASVAPHSVRVEAILARQYWGNGMNDVRRGNALARRGDWQDAEEAWRAALKNNPQNHAAYHNLAVACEARGDFDSAIENVDRALKHFAATLYHQTRTRISAERRDHSAALAQAQSRPHLAPPANSLAPLSIPPANGPIPASYSVPTQASLRLPPPGEAR